MELAYRYRASMAHVVDADTFDLMVDLGFRTYAKVRVRLRAINTPELSTSEGQQARAWLVNHVQLPASPLVIESYRDRQSFARWICDVWVDGRPLVDLIVEAGHGERA